MTTTIAVVHARFKASDIFNETCSSKLAFIKPFSSFYRINICFYLEYIFFFVVTYFLSRIKL